MFINTFCIIIKILELGKFEKDNYKSLQVCFVKFRVTG